MPTAVGRSADHFASEQGVVSFRRGRGVHTNSIHLLGECARLRGLGSMPPDQSILAEVLRLRDWN